MKENIELKPAHRRKSITLGKRVKSPTLFGPSDYGLWASPKKRPVLVGGTNNGLTMMTEVPCQNDALKRHTVRTFYVI